MQRRGDSLPRFNVQKLTGRRIAKILSVLSVLVATLCGWIVIARSARVMEFSECRVDGFRLDVRIPCVTIEALDAESHWGCIKFSVPIAAGKVGPCELRDLHVGQRLQAIRAIACDKGDEGDAVELTERVWLRLLDFATDEPTVALPQFDGTAITGDELVALLRAHKNCLSPNQIDELQKKLLGRHLTFTGMRLRSYGGSDVKVDSADFRFSDIGFQLSVKLKPIEWMEFESQKRDTLTGTVAGESANDAYGNRALRLTDGVLE